MEDISLLQLVLSLIGGGVSGAVVSFFLDKKKRKQIEQEEIKRIKNGIFVETKGNLKKLNEAIDKKEKLQYKFLNNSLVKLDFLSPEELAKVNSIDNEIEKFNERVLKSTINDNFSNEIKKIFFR
ncbi:MAG: hypothetical protein OIN90_01935 [Candidatus Methanoperedens sp.]|nr:hypothetical protein [Candidatus Methanoperedens sp.]